MPLQIAETSIIVSDAAKAEVQRLLAEGIRDGSVQRLNEGEPFTLLVSYGLATQLQAQGVCLASVDARVGAGTSPCVLNQRLVLDALDEQMQPSSAPLIAFYDHNMNTLMQALNGIKVVCAEPLAPGTTVAQTRYVNRAAANHPCCALD